MFLCISFIKVFAQEYTISNYTVENGLAQSTVYSICEDNNGFIWFSTLGGGVSRFDGVHFTTITEEDGLASNQVYSIFQDSKNNIWFGTRSGVSVYDGLKFKTYTTDDGLKSNLIRTITEDPKGVVWVGTFGGGISKFQNNRFSSYNSEDGLLSDYVYSINFNDQDLIIGTKDGYCYFNGQRFYINELDSNRNKPIRVIKVIGDQTWIGGQESGISIIKNSETSYIYDSTIKTRNNVSDIFIVNKNEYWISTFNNGVFHVVDSTIYNYNTDNSILKSNIALKLFKDSGGGIWVGTFGGGVSKLSKTPMFSYYKEPWLKEKAIRCFYESNNNQLLMGSRGYGIISPYNVDDIFNQFSNYTINKIYSPKKKNEIWVLTNENGLFKIDSSQKVIHYSIENGFPSNKIYSIIKDSDNDTWVGTYDNGLIKISSEGDYKVFNTSSTDLAYDVIYDILLDDFENVWVATNGGGISIIDKNENIKNITIEDGLPSNDIWSLRKDFMGNIWIGSNGGGISMYNGENFTNFDVNEGLISNNIHSLIFDDANNLWVGTERGVDKIIFVLKDTLNEVKYSIFKVQHYGKQEGLWGIETNLNASYKDSKGNIWFGTINGATKYNPNMEFFNKKEPRINLTNIKLRLNNVDWKKKYKSKLYKWSKLPKNLKLRSFDNHIKFEFSAISSHYSNKIKYKVKLDGFDSDWSNPSPDNYAIYSNLPSGEYVFKVIACNENGVWTQKPASFSFSIRTPIWKMPIFYAGIVILIIVLIYLYLKRKEFKIRKEKLKLERTVHIRTKQLREEKNNVELQNIEIVSQKRELEIKKAELETKNTQILDSINYAKRLQRSIITSDEKFDIHFKEKFIFFSPKDIVSGDFQWLREEGDLIYFAAADCTGHGVPGAFMSIVCNRLLNETVQENSFDNPAKLLKHVHNRLIEVLEKGVGEDTYVRDGMDLALCIFNKKTKELKYSGAHNPLLFVRNNEIQKIEGDNMALGFSMGKKKEKEFTTHTLQLQTDDQLYIFSDGFADQFGGPKRQKYFYQNFEKFLLKISSLPMDDQYVEVVNEFLNWRGENEQIDDVLVIGVKIK